MKSILFKSAILGLTLAVGVPAMAQHRPGHGNSPRPAPAPAPVPHRDDHRRDDHRDHRDNRRGEWHRGRVITDGGDEELDVNGVYPAGSGDFAWRDLVTAWGERCIDSIVVIGETMPLRDGWGRPIPTRAQSLVEVWGLK